MRNSKSIIAGAFLSLAFISGCSTTSAPRPTWQKVGVDSHNTRNAIQQCRYEIGIAKVDAESQSNLFRACMESKGFRHTSKRLNP